MGKSTAAAEPEAYPTPGTYRQRILQALLKSENIFAKCNREQRNTISELILEIEDDLVEHHDALLEALASSNIDWMTGLSVLSALLFEPPSEFSLMARILIYSIRNGVPLALLMHDLDFFKDINDTLGEDTADQVIVEVSKKLVQHYGPQQPPEVYGLIRPYSGGDEYFRFLPAKSNFHPDMIPIPPHTIQVFVRPNAKRVSVQVGVSVVCCALFLQPGKKSHTCITWRHLNDTWGVSSASETFQDPVELNLPFPPKVTDLPTMGDIGYWNNLAKHVLQILRRRGKIAMVYLKKFEKNIAR